MENLHLFGDAVGGAEAIIDLNSQNLISTATSTAKLYDFGDDLWLKGFEKRISGLNSTNLHLTGRLYYKVFFLMALRNRLLVTDKIKTCPAILDEKISCPVIITGLPRTGTTFLFELLSQDKRFHCPIAKEALCPIEPPKYMLKGGIDRKTIVQTLQSIFLSHSQLKAMHYINYDRPVECYSIMEALLNSQVPEILNNNYDKWLKDIDAENNYKWHKTILSLLQYEKPTKKWILKCPYHLNHLEKLFNYYPDAQVIHTHRDPRNAVSSLLNASKKENELYTNDPTNTESLKRLIVPLEGSLKKSISQRKTGAIPEQQITDVYFNDLVKNPISTIESIYQKIGLRINREFRENLSAYIKENPRNKHGKYSYKATEFGLSDQDILNRFKFYTDHYHIKLSAK